MEASAAAAISSFFLDRIQLLRATRHGERDCRLFVFTEPWLNDTVPDSAIQLSELTCYHTDRVLTAGGGTRDGGSVCLHQ